MAQMWWRLVKFGFRLLYNEMAFTYDTVSKVVSLGAWRCWQRSGLKHLDVQPGALVLELAHGTGDLQLDLKAQGYRTIGYDLSPYMGRIARRKLRRNEQSADLVRGIAQRLPFPAASFDAVVCTFPTSFIVEAATLGEAQRVLKPGCRLVIVLSGAFTGSGAVEGSIEWLYRITGQREGSFEVAEGIFTANGFDIDVAEELCPRSVAQMIIARKRL